MPAAKATYIPQTACGGWSTGIRDYKAVANTTVSLKARHDVDHAVDDFAERNEVVATMPTLGCAPSSTRFS